MGIKFTSHTVFFVCGSILGKWYLNLNARILDFYSFLLQSFDLTLGAGDFQTPPYVTHTVQHTVMNNLLIFWFLQSSKSFLKNHSTSHEK